MPNELNIFFDNIRRFRKPLLTEAVSDSAIVNSIKNRELVYLYYAGDETVMKGYRIVVPFVLGKHENGNTLLRAWQLEGNSDSFIGLAGRKRKNHEYHIDHDGSTKIGWRLFKTDKISSFLPTGDKFIDPKTDEYITPPLYNPNDKQMSSIIAAAPESGEVSHFTGIDKISEPDVAISTADKSTFNTQSNKFKQFHQAGGTPTPQEIEAKYDLIRNVKHRSPKDYILYRYGNQFRLAGVKQGEKMEQSQVVGNLRDLYNKYVVPTKQTDTQFFDNQRNKIKGELQKTNMGGDSLDRPTFFKK